MPPFNSKSPEPTPAERLAKAQEIIARNKALSEERALQGALNVPPEVTPVVTSTLRAKKESRPLPRIIGKSAAAGRDDAPEIRHVGNGVFEEVKRED